MTSIEWGKPFELTQLITLIANSIACALPSDKITLLASILVQLSDTLNTIVAADALITSRNRYAH